jgi:hypothetical protein
MITVEGPSKPCEIPPVDDPTFDIGPGKVTGFLEPNRPARPRPCA